MRARCEASLCCRAASLTEARSNEIASFNINNVNRRLPNLLNWLETAKPDVVCLQELKCEQAAFPAAALAQAGYRRSGKGNARGMGLPSCREELSHSSRARRYRVTRRTRKAATSKLISTALVVGCIYLPNGNPQPGPKFDYKLAWFKRLQAHSRKLLKYGTPVVLAGDFNVVPTELDIYPTSSWDDDALVQPESRAAYAKLVGQGWTDALREVHPGKRLYTFWHYWRHSWQRNAGLRIDHLLLSPALAQWLHGAGIDRAIRGKSDASDPAPAWIKLKKPQRKKRHR